MSCLAFDGTFEGFLTVFARIMGSDRPPEAILPQREVPPLLETVCPFVATEHAEAERIRSLLAERLPAEVRRGAYAAFLSEEPGIPTWVARYLLMALELDGEVDLHLTEEAVHRVHRARKKTLNERHRLLGLIRFRKTGHIYYAPIEPDTNVLELLGRHFATRFGDQKGLIHDLKREKALFFQEGRWKVVPLRRLGEIDLGEEEEKLQALWRQYFRSVTVQGRENPGLQRRYMPRRYWKHLVEKPEDEA